MKTLEQTTIDKSAWLDGPWQSEPDKKQWMTEAGLPGLIVRGPSGALCGYVGVSVGHPYYKKDYDEIDVQVHGGLTFSRFCQPTDEQGHGVCHVVEPGEDDAVWWLGFDCAHSYDFAPGNFGVPALTNRQPFEHETYRDVAYVTGEVESLASQLVCIAEGLAIYEEAP